MGPQESFPKVLLTEQDKEGGVRGIHCEVGDDLQFIEVFID